ncbi:MAG: hypothetical protein JWR07_648 [Nevskia sp.]|nr:hypothetical protein [Nevskia sp.]
MGQWANLDIWEHSRYLSAATGTRNGLPLAVLRDVISSDSSTVIFARKEAKSGGGWAAIEKK